VTNALIYKIINSLFHVVVDNERIAAEILKNMTDNRAGRVTFMPLNRLKARSFDLPNNFDASPIIEILQFDSKFRPAFQQVCRFSNLKT
jgi:structural maintenance of chromosome 3 (chondroitin sulfate proteoglycan 6)